MCVMVCVSTILLLFFSSFIFAPSSSYPLSSSHSPFEFNRRPRRANRRPTCKIIPLTIPFLFLVKAATRISPRNNSTFPSREVPIVFSIIDHHRSSIARVSRKCADDAPVEAGSLCLLSFSSSFRFVA